MLSEVYEMLDELLIFGGILFIALFKDWDNGLFMLASGLILMISRGELDLPFISSHRHI